jgi:Excalibur calcium-binding domain
MYMSARKNADSRSIALIALIAFVAGRCSVDDRASSVVTSDTQQQSFSEPLPITDVESAGSPDQLSGVRPLTVEETGSDDRMSVAAPVAALETQPDDNVYYRNCSAARAAGAAPVRAGDPGYAPHLDRDRDGVGCE